MLRTLICLFLFLAPLSSLASGVGTIIISEVMWMGSDISTADEWVEITNTGEQPQSIGGYALTIMKTTGESTIATFPAGLTIDPGQYLVISNYGRLQSRLDIDPAFSSTSMTLPNTKLLLRLHDAGGNLLDEVDDYVGEPFAGTNATGQPKASMERIDLAGSGALKTNWRTASISIGFDSGLTIFGTSGYSIQFESSSSIQSQSTNSIQEYTPQSSSQQSDVGSTCLLASGSTLNPTILIQSGRLSGTEPVTVNLQAVASSGSLKNITCHWDYGDGYTSESCNPGTHTMRAKGSYFIHLFTHDQCVNTVERTVQVNVLEKGGSSYFTQDNSPSKACMASAFSGALISEFLPNPVSGEEPGEWIELYNPTDVSIPLCGWFLDDASGGSKPYSLSRYQLPSKEYLLIDRHESGIALNNSQDTVRLLAPVRGAGTGVLMQVPYTQAPSNQSYALRQDGNWLWTDHLTPGKPNAFPNLSSVTVPAVVIRSAFPNPRGKDEGEEWIEFENLLTDRPQWLNGWTLSNLRGKEIPLNGIVLKKKETKQILVADISLSLANSIDGLILRDAKKDIASVLQWDNAKEGKIVRTPLKAKQIEGMVTRVIDGDTVEVSVNREHLTIRLLGIDAPEFYDDSGSISDYGLKSKNYVSALIENKKVELEFDSNKTDKYGRTLAYLFLDDAVDIQRELVLKGLAYAYRAFPVSRLGEYEVYESLAREQKLGIWSSVASSEYYLAKEKEQEQWAEVENQGLQISIDQKSGLVESGTVVHLKTSIPWAKVYVSLNGSSFLAFSGALIVDKDTTMQAFAQTKGNESGAVMTSKKQDRFYVLKRDHYPRGIVISEVYASPQKGEQEWVEVWNPSDQTIDLSGWKINKFSVPMGTSIAAGGRMMFEKNLTHQVLRNTGDTVRLLDPNGAIAASVTYPKLKNGQSYSVRDGAYCITDDATPGEENTCVIHSKKRASKKSLVKDTGGLADARSLLASLEGQVVEKADAFSPHLEPSSQKTIAEAILLTICFAWAMFVLWVLLKK